MQIEYKGKQLPVLIQTYPNGDPSIILVDGDKQICITNWLRTPLGVYHVAVRKVLDDEPIFERLYQAGIVGHEIFEVSEWFASYAVCELKKIA